MSGYPNRSGFVLKALQSALQQNYKNFNILLRLGYQIPGIEKLISEKVTISYFDHQMIGVGQKLGRNIAESLQFFNEYICLLDDDDTFHPDKLKRINDEFNHGVVYIHNGIVAVDESGEKLDYQNDRDDFNNSSISVDRRILEYDFFNELDSSLDTGIYLSAIKFGRLKFIDDKLTYLTIHKSTTMGYTGDFNTWREKKLFSYKNIIQPTYSYMLEYFRGTRAEIYAQRMYDINSIFMDIYEDKGIENKIGFFKKLKLALVKPYLKSSDRFAKKVILGSIFSKKKVLIQLYENDKELLQKLQNYD